MGSYEENPAPPSDYASAIAGIAGTELDVKYDGTVLTNSADHQFLAQLAARVDAFGKTLTLPSGSMAGATSDAADAKLAALRTKFEKTADDLKKIASAAQKASPTISSGTSKDAAVQEALKTSSSVYREVAAAREVWGEEVDEMGGGADEPTGNPTAPEGTDKPHDPAKDTKPEGGAKPAAPLKPETHTSADTTGTQQSQGGGQSQAAPAVPQMPQTAPQGGAAMPMMGGTATPQVGQQRPGTAAASPPAETLGQQIQRIAQEEVAKQRAPGTDKPSTGIKPERGHSPGSDTDSSGTTTVAAVPAGNPSVIGGAVAPEQTSGRTSSTATSAAAPIPSAARPAASPMGTGMMGGMAPMGGLGGPGGGTPPTGGAPIPAPRDKASERVFTGEASRDKALISSILHDGDDFTIEEPDEVQDDGLDGPRNPPRGELADDAPW